MIFQDLFETPPLYGRIKIQKIKIQKNIKQQNHFILLKIKHLLQVIVNSEPSIIAYSKHKFSKRTYKKIKLKNKYLINEEILRKERLERKKLV